MQSFGDVHRRVSQSVVHIESSGVAQVSSGGASFFRIGQCSSQQVVLYKSPTRLKVLLSTLLISRNSIGQSPLETKVFVEKG